MAVQRFVAFDLGAESGRAVLGTLDGGQLELEEKHRFLNPHGKMHGRLQWNLLAQWEEIKTGLRKAAGPGRVELAGIGVDTWGVDFALVDEEGEILGNPVTYRDSRTDGVMDRTFTQFSKQRIFDATGIQFMPFNTLYQLIALRDTDGALLKVARSLLLMPDLFNYLLSGERRSEVSNSSTTQMYDPRKKQWATEMLAALDLPARLLAPLIASGTVVGPLLRDVAEECGVGRVPVIAPASHDTASAVAAVPVGDALPDGATWCYISSGTWSLMGVEIDEPIITPQSLAYNYTNEVGAEGKIRFLKNIMGLWLIQECRRQWESQGYDHSYAELATMAERATPLGALIDPDYEPFLTPGDMTGKIEKFCQSTRQRPPSTRGEYVRVCLDSLALTYRRTIQRLEELTGRKIGIIHIVGGGARNELLNQLTADACARPVIAGPVEATAAGNILVQAMAVGQVKSIAHARTIVRQSFDVKRYEPAGTKAWDKAYDKFVGSILKK